MAMVEVAGYIKLWDVATVCIKLRVCRSEFQKTSVSFIPPNWNNSYILRLQNKPMWYKGIWLQRIDVGQTKLSHNTIGTER